MKRKKSFKQANQKVIKIDIASDCEDDLQEGLTMFVLFIGLMVMGYSLSCFGAKGIIVSGIITLVSTGIALALECKNKDRKDSE